MTRRVMSLVTGLLISGVASAQEFGATIGIHQTTASVDSTTAGTSLYGQSGSVSGKLGFDVGMTAAFELVPNVRFRSGLLFNQRQVDYKLASGAGTVSYNFSYIDIPVNGQYNFTPMIGIYGGLIVGVKAGDSVNTPSNLTISPNMKTMYPLVNVGANFMFEDLIGFDVYYEAGIGDAADNVKNFSTFGMHFIYWL